VRPNYLFIETLNIYRCLHPYLPVSSSPPVAFGFWFWMGSGSDHCSGPITTGPCVCALMMYRGRDLGDEGDREKSIPYKRPKKKPGTKAGRLKSDYSILR